MYVIGVGGVAFKVDADCSTRSITAPFLSTRKCLPFCRFNCDINGIYSIASWEGVCCEIDLIHNA